MRATVVVLTKLPGFLPVKTRLWPGLGRDGARRLYEWMLRETLNLARQISAWPIVAFSPADADPAAALPGLGGCRFLGVSGQSGAECMETAILRAYERGPLLILGGDAPDLPVNRLAEAVAALDSRDAVLVPSYDGGFTCLGLRKPVRDLASGFAFGSGGACRSLRAFFVSRSLSVATLAPWPDVDTLGDLAALLSRCARAAEVLR